MAHTRCVQLDILSNQLFEAYRKINEAEISGIWNFSDNGVGSCRSFAFRDA